MDDRERRKGNRILNHKRRRRKDKVGYWRRESDKQRSER